MIGRVENQKILVEIAVGGFFVLELEDRRIVGGVVVFGDLVASSRTPPEIRHEVAAFHFAHLAESALLVVAAL